MSTASSTPVQSMEIFLPSRSSSSTQPVSMLNLQALSSYFMFVSSWNHVVAYVGQSMISDFTFHGHLHGACRDKAPPSCLRKTVPSLKSPTGAFIAAQTLIFRRKQTIRTHLLSETSSDYFCLVRVARIELTASWTPLCFSQKRNGHSDTTCTQYHQISKLFYHSVSLDVKMFRFFCGQIVVNRPWQMTILPY